MQHGTNSCKKMKICLRKQRKDRLLVKPPRLVDWFDLWVFHVLPAWPCSNHYVHLWIKMMSSSQVPSILACFCCPREHGPSVAGGPNSAEDMLFGPVVFISGEKEEPLGQKSRCVPKAEHQICKFRVSAPMSLQGRGVVRPGYLLLYVCAHSWCLDMGP